MSYLDYYCELLKNKFLATGKITEKDIRGYQTKQLNKNLFAEMSEKTKNEYFAGDGNELRKGRIDMIRSSAAMIYNLLGNNDVCISENAFLPSGIYEKEFEKHYQTINVINKKTNILIPKKIINHCSRRTNHINSSFTQLISIASQIFIFCFIRHLMKKILF